MIPRKKAGDEMLILPWTFWQFSLTLPTWNKNNDFEFDKLVS